MLIEEGFVPAEFPTANRSSLLILLSAKWQRQTHFNRPFVACFIIPFWKASKQRRTELSGRRRDAQARPTPAMDSSTSCVCVGVKYRAPRRYTMIQSEPGSLHGKSSFPSSLHAIAFRQQPVSHIAQGCMTSNLKIIKVRSWQCRTGKVYERVIIGEICNDFGIIS